MFKPSKLRTYLLLAQDAGLSPAAILEGSGVAWADVEALAPLDLPTIAGLFDQLARRTPAGFALRSGHASKVRGYGIVGFATMTMPTLRDALRHWSDYCLIAGDPLVTRITEEGDRWRMVFETRVFLSASARRYCIEAAVAALEPVIEELTDALPESLRIDFSFPRPADEGDYRLFHAPELRFGCAETIYHGRRSDLDRPIPASDPAVRDMLLRECDQFLSALTHARSASERIEDLLRASPGAVPSLAEMARALGLSRRSLQRELHEEGLSYQQVVRGFRERHAAMLLRENPASLKAIAHTLGFKDVGSFRRAFRGWTGETVGRGRARALHAPRGPAPQMFARAAAPGERLMGPTLG